MISQTYVELILIKGSVHLITKTCSSMLLQFQGPAVVRHCHTVMVYWDTTMTTQRVCWEIFLFSEQTNSSL